MQGKVEHFARFDKVCRTEPDLIFLDDQIRVVIKDRVSLNPRDFFQLHVLGIYFSCKYTAHFLLLEQWRKLTLLMLLIFQNFLCSANEITDFLPVPKSWTFCSAIHVLMPTTEVLNQDTGMSILFKVHQGKATVLTLYFQVIHKYCWKYLKHTGMFNRPFFFILLLIPRHFNVCFQMVNVQQPIRLSWTRVRK